MSSGRPGGAFAAAARADRARAGYLLAGFAFIAISATAPARAEGPDCSTVPSGKAAWSKSGEGACRIQPPTPVPSVSMPGSPLATDMKGWELYSWRDRGQWKYALLAGTNRSPIGAELQAAATSDLVAVEARLRALPAKSEIFWNPAHAELRRLKLEKPAPHDRRRRELHALCDSLQQKLSD